MEDFFTGLGHAVLEAIVGGRVRQGSMAALDVTYHPDKAVAACVTFDDWRDGEPCRSIVRAMPVAAPYVPGAFTHRELPSLLAILEELAASPSHLIVDGFVWLDASGRAGLGANLWHALGEEAFVIGVAKNPFDPLPPCVAVRRGRSRRPLFVSAAGMSAQRAGRLIRRMHGPYRIPTLLRRVDQLSRGR